MSNELSPNAVACAGSAQFRTVMRNGSGYPLRTADTTALFGHSFVIRHSDFVIHTGAMLDIRLIREKPDFVRERLATRGGGEEARIDDVLRIDAERRKSETELQRLQSERNRLSKEIGT